MNIEDDLDELEAYLGFKPERNIKRRTKKVSFFKRLFNRKKKTDEWG